MAFNYDGREIDLLSYLPFVFKDTKEEQAIQYAIEREFELFYTELNRVFNGGFIFNTDEQMIARWEQMLNITSSPTDTLENRQFRVYSLWNSNVVYTENGLHELLTSLCGSGNYKLTINVDEFSVIIGVALNSSNNVETVTNVMKDIIPANMLLTVEYLYNSYEMLANKTHDELSSMTHTQLKMEVE